MNLPVRKWSPGRAPLRNDHGFSSGSEAIDTKGLLATQIAEKLYLLGKEVAPNPNCLPLPEPLSPSRLPLLTARPHCRLRLDDAEPGACHLTVHGFQRHSRSEGVPLLVLRHRGGLGAVRPATARCKARRPDDAHPYQDLDTRRGWQNRQTVASPGWFNCAAKNSKLRRPELERKGILLNMFNWVWLLIMKPVECAVIPG
jgi:hypothetical protein